MSQLLKNVSHRHAITAANSKPNDPLAFSCRGDIVSMTPKAILFRPTRTRRHGAYVPQLWVPRHAIPEKFPPGHYVFPHATTVTIPEWYWIQNARPEPAREAS